MWPWYISNYERTHLRFTRWFWGNYSDKKKSCCNLLFLRMRIPASTIFPSKSLIWHNCLVWDIIHRILRYTEGCFYRFDKWGIALSNADIPDVTWQMTSRFGCGSEGHIKYPHFGIHCINYIAYMVVFEELRSSRHWCVGVIVWHLKSHTVYVITFSYLLTDPSKVCIKLYPFMAGMFA